MCLRPDELSSLEKSKLKRDEFLKRLPNNIFGLILKKVLNN